MSTIRWRVHFTSPPEEVYRYLATSDGRRRFWASSAEEEGGQVRFRFMDGTMLESRITVAAPPREFGLTYFGGSVVSFRLDPDGNGGTDLLLTEEGVPDADLDDNRPGWVSVLLNLKAAVELGGDLRNGDPERSWDRGYVDV